ncbi:hypothetical protein KGM_211235 [Danaus plexippus plexippus]|uniref:Protein FAM161A n=1 Tax=Danaus plexippus plexippus TaxID=278856 RepID=A0A212FF08_DANPL|nr:hypothetical protein KGM_211235 [Danaus plexippus plexippus]
MPKTAYERSEKEGLTEQCSIESSSCSVSAADVDANKLKDFYRSIPDYSDINHLSESEFYSTLKILREKKKLMLGLAVEHIDNCKVNSDKLFEDIDREINISLSCTTKNNPIHRRKNSVSQVNKTSDSKEESVFKSQKDSCKRPTLCNKNSSLDVSAKEVDKNLQIGTTKNNLLMVKGGPKLDRPKRNHSACSISWHDDKVEPKSEVDDKFKKFFHDNDHSPTVNDDSIYKTQSMPSSPLRTRQTGSCLRPTKILTVPQPFKMTQRKRFRARPVPIESRIPLYDKILQDQAMRRAITKINSEAELRAQMKPFSFTKREENGISGTCDRAINILPKSKRKKRFKARPVPKNLFSNYFYDKVKDENFFRSLNKRIRAEEMLRHSSFPGSIGVRERSRLSTPAVHSDLPTDPSPVVPSISSSEPNRSSSRTKELRRARRIKEDFVTTSPRPFRFSTADRASKKINDISKKICQDSKSCDSIERNETPFDKTTAYTALDLKAIVGGRSNLAALLRAEAVRQKFELESAQRLAEQRRRVENRQRDRLLRSKPAWHLVKNNYEEDIAMRLQTRRDEERLRREEFLHEMELMYGRVQQQPMLFERYYAPRSGASTIDFVKLSPRKTIKKKHVPRKSGSQLLASPCLSFEDQGTL